MSRSGGQLPRGALPSLRGLAPLVALALLALLPAACTPAGGEARPDVVLISIDTLRAEHTSLYGYSRKTTPRLEELAREAVLYENAISPATWTVPAHASMFTGLLPSFHGANQVMKGGYGSLPLDESFVTLAEILSQRGYETAAFIGNTGFLKKVFGVGQGFATYVDKHMWNATFVNRAAFAWLDAREPGPFFLFVNYLDPHEPYSAPKPYNEAFPGRQEDFVDVRRLVRKGEHQLTPEEREHYISQYDGEILYVDEMVGRLIDRLKQDGHYDDALLIITSDHGDLFGEHGMFGHGGLPYDGLIRVPLVVKYPRQDLARRVDTYVSTVDITPTVLDLLDIDPPVEMQGQPLGSRRGPVLSEHHERGGVVTRVLHDGDTKLFVREKDGERRADLFDVASDPAEQSPLPGRERERRELLALLEERVRGANPPRAEEVPTVGTETRQKLRELGYVE